jgi:hypothetical protein
MYLPFLHDEAAAQQLLRNRQRLETDAADDELAPAEAPTFVSGSPGTLH